ncbi:MAG: hypothetical protein IPH45_17660, partial [Bacteroidales bacterium]|nr:hypothetical protein [Bacteroidales bacterium]
MLQYAGGTVTVSVNNNISGHRYRFRQTNPSGGPASQEITSGGGTITYIPVSPTEQPYSIWTVDDRDGDFAQSFNIYVVNDPIAPVLTLSHAAGTICAGPDIYATQYSAGTDGYNCIDSYEYSVDGGLTWSAYTLGSNISSTLFQIPSIQIKAKRADSQGRGCSAENVYIW